MAVPSLEIHGASRLRLPPPHVILAGCVLVGLVIAAVGADWIAPYPFDELHVANRLHGPSLAYLAAAQSASAIWALSSPLL